MSRFLKNSALAAACAAAVLLGACSSTPERPKPTALEALPAASTSAKPVWSQRVGGSSLPLRLVVAGDAVVAASEDGQIAAYDLASGRERWKGTAGGRISAGIGSDGRYASVVTRDNELVGFDNGKEIWRKTLRSRVVTAPLVAGERVFVQGVDRVVLAFDAADGGKLWTFQRAGDPLTLLQPGLLQPVGNTLWVGVGPRLVALDPLDGAARQDVVVASPRGTNEVERLADIVGPAGRVDNALCVRAFQTSVGCIQASVVSPSLRWSKAQAGSQGVAADAEVVVGADVNDRVLAWRFGSGDVAWRNDRLAYRGLTAPVIVGGKVAVGDSEGYVHLISRDDGRTLGRLSTDGSGFSVPPVATASGWLLTLTKSGQLEAWRID
jgi:outer membrane protein assembly factor BamB